ncbi:ABC-F family ATP-binding cassette domain-containing protein [Melissococcus plutonius]|uniref:ABC transporter ATP-binding protein Uup n=1 Tax=Melissococcus plutonius (strain ATCC 35311 / DSM 29964 / CIP 104052 / LMG 20360 / NCIMB 702443) TaxID=940190 RepID=F3Y7N6_MELPT|nr:ATP-binding cassette domain-containing protein [Melissococcus plutonius]AIM24324.1 putative ABC transporter ATP-binding protein YheS [Melissococcus plutonius S1]KMT25681.1 putative ABC transporter ATP-binding protein YheS [Melissococcus plutonius]KMT27025.1 putative ABC transporter ATP-binding protein YheS [Melissococcus plutonius]KMT28401.1 putative ABC transporter ATP-binding protein YheS [Melissococcus plutonius]KMT30451.1 putative ABC transporter ATP-binding protein YheS [Melissococcus 
MITVNDVSLQFSDRKLFDDVNIKFTSGNCYGLIGANGAGKSTFLKILSGDIAPTTGVVSLDPNARLATLKQNHFDYEEYTVLETVIMGHKQLYEIMKEKDAIYMKTDFSDQDGIRAAELEGEFAELNGWEAEPEAAVLLQGLNIQEDLHNQKMSELTAGQKVKVLLAQSLFGKPDVLLLDEPTNGLDTRSIAWLEEFLINFDNTIIVVSHDRHFLNKVCTHMADLDFGKIKLYVGNYDFWLESSQLATKLQTEQNAKKEEQIKELQDFIARFSANASKSKQATSRKKMLEKITLDDIQPSSRRYPFIGFKPEREIGNDLLQVDNITVTIEGKKIIDNLSFTLNREDKVAFISDNDIVTTTLIKVIMGEIKPDSGSVRWGVTTSQAYLPKDTTKDFNTNLTILDWLRQFASKEEDDNTFLRSFLGRMLFSGEEVLKPVNVLSGGEKVRVMLSKMMLSKANTLILDDPTNHLDLESITALNDGLIAFSSAILFTSHDHQFIQTLANRIIAISTKGIIDRAETTYDEFLGNEDILKQMNQLFKNEI